MDSENVPAVIAELGKVVKVWDWWLDDAGNAHARLKWSQAWTIISEAERAGEMWAHKVRASTVADGCLAIEAFVFFEVDKVWIYADGGGIVEFSR